MIVEILTFIPRFLFFKKDALDKAIPKAIPEPVE